MVIQNRTKYKIKGKSHYFRRKYGAENPIIDIEEKLDFRKSWTPASMLYLGRMLAENISEKGDTFYGHINGMGEFVHESELEEIS